MLFILYLTRAGERITRQDLGVPKKWETIESWFDGSRGVKQYVDKCWNKWSYAKKKVAKQSMDRLDGKVPVALQKELKSIMCKNAKSAVVNGRFMTDTIGSWIKKKYVAGPFDQPRASPY